MSLEKLIKQRVDLEKKIQAIDDEISLFDDGYKYKIVVSSYMFKTTYNFTNLYSFKKKFNQYYCGDDGVIVMIETNNPKIKHLEFNGI